MKLAVVSRDRVVAAMRRVADDDGFRSKVHRGGSAELAIREGADPLSDGAQ